MTLPVLERIAQEIVTRLQAGPTDGWTYPLTRVERPTRAAGLSFDNMTVGLVQHEPESSAVIPGNPPAIEWSQPFALYLVVRQSDKDKTPEDQVLNAFEADVKAAITETADWYQFGGLSVNASFDPSVPFAQDGGASSGRVLMLRVIYRVDETDARQVRA